MAKISYTRQALHDLKRLSEFLFETHREASAEITALILDGINILQSHPQVGRPKGNGLRELIISRGSTGYVALYDFYPSKNEALILTIRHQREVGYQKRFSAN